MRRAWVLNFDGDDELAAPARYKAPTAAVAARFATLRTRVGPLLRDEDVVVESGRRVEGYEGWAFCATPRARDALVKAGAVVPRWPAVDVVRRVNDRGFAARLGLGAPHSRYVQTAEEVRAAAGSGAAEDWLLKRAFGFAGRGRRKVRAVLTAEDRAWIDASLRDGDGLIVEPWVAIEREFGLHGWIAEDGAVTLGELTVQECTKEGAWIGTRRAAPGDATEAEHTSVHSAAISASKALAGAGYFGAFGIDAYRTRDGAFVALSDLNARFSMGWAVGFGRAPFEPSGSALLLPHSKGEHGAASSVPSE
jgi:hypothetical protein